MFCFGIIPGTNKTYVLLNRLPVGLIISSKNSIIHTGFKWGIIKLIPPIIFEFSFVISILLKRKMLRKNKYLSFIQKNRILRLCDIHWRKIKQCRNANKAYINFFTIIDSLCDECFQVAKIRLKQKKHIAPWITRGIKKSCKRKKNLYKKKSKT